MDIIDPMPLLPPHVYTVGCTSSYPYVTIFVPIKKKHVDTNPVRQ